jgi:hypothetical protein
MKETFKKMTIYDDYEYEVSVHLPYTSLFLVPPSTFFLSLNIRMTIRSVQFLARVPIASLFASHRSPLALPLHPLSLLVPRFYRSVLLPAELDRKCHESKLLPYVVQQEAVQGDLTLILLSCGGFVKRHANCIYACTVECVSNPLNHPSNLSDHFQD